MSCNRTMAIAARGEPAEAELSYLLALDAAAFKARITGTPIQRRKCDMPGRSRGNQ